MRVSESAASNPVRSVSSNPVRRGGMNGENFDYGTLSHSVARFLQGQAERIRRQCATSIIQMGKALIEAKRHLSHGGFVQWVECEVGIPARTAQAYMRAANWASGKSATVAHLPPSAVYLLSAANVPEEFVSEILHRIDAGEQIAPSAMREQLKAFQQKKQKAISECPKTNGGDSVVSFHEKHQGRSPIVELVALLSQKLSTQDFARVSEIFTSDRVLSDPHLAENLGKEFRSAAANRMAMSTCA
jgi:hypothetical protein